jgi:hypothetical protein
MEFDLPHTPAFFEYARERYNIKLRRDAGKFWPWTEDPILQTFRFCNVFREDDKVTKWIRSVITDAGYGERILGALIIARWFNRIETLEAMLPPPGSVEPFFRSNLLYNWDQTVRIPWAEEMRRRFAGVSPIVTAAYMIKTPAGMNKLDGLIWCIQQALPGALILARTLSAATKQRRSLTLEMVHGQLKQYPYLGDFMAYEVVTDLRHTNLLREAPDVHTWASPGPGAARGFARVQGAQLDTYKYSQEKDRKVLIAGMRDLLELSRSKLYWPERWPAWEMREVEHTLCEFDKYERARLGEGQPKQRYRRG